MCFLEKKSYWYWHQHRIWQRCQFQNLKKIVLRAKKREENLTFWFLFPLHGLKTWLVKYWVAAPRAAPARPAFPAWPKMKRFCVRPGLLFDIDLPPPLWGSGMASERIKYWIVKTERWYTSPKPDMCSLAKVHYQQADKAEHQYNFHIQLKMEIYTFSQIKYVGQITSNCGF